MEPEKTHPFQQAYSQYKEPEKGGHPFEKSKKQQKNRPWLIGGLIALVTLSGLVYYFYSSGKGEIIILDTSKDLEISLNNKTVPVKSTKDGYSIPAFAGQYRLQIKKPSHVTYVQDIKLDRGQTLSIRPAFAFQPTSQKSDTTGVSFAKPSIDEKSLFYLGDGGRTIYRMEVANQVKIPLTDPVLSGVTDIQWSSTPNVALITQTNGIYLREIPKYDFRNQILVRLGGNEIISPIWHPQDPEKLAFAYFPPSGEKSLIISDKRLSSLDRKADIRNVTNPKLVWSSDAKNILLINRSANPTDNNIWKFNTTDGSYAQITQSGSIVDASFSPENDTIMYEDTSSTIFIIKADGSDLRKLTVTGKIATATWKDNASFYLPGANNSLDLYTLSGVRQSVPFSFPSDLTIKGTHYFASSKTLIFYTSDAVYTVNLGV